MKIPKSSKPNVRVAVVVPHVFMQDSILPHVIFSPGHLAKDLVNGLGNFHVDVTLFSPGRVDVDVPNITADLSYFESELELRSDTYLDLLKKHPLTFITLSRQVQAELISAAFQMANDDQFDVVHIYTNEEDTALPFATLCSKPVVFSHHDPFNFLANYRSLFPKYPKLNWISISGSQRKSMPEDTNWLGTVHHGIPKDRFRPNYQNNAKYVAYLGRIIEPKGVNLAINAVLKHNAASPGNEIALHIAGKHYAGKQKNTYWDEIILPKIDGKVIKYIGHLKTNNQKQEFLENALALIVPSIFDEPFGMVSIEALACGTPVIGLDSGAIPEIITDSQNGLLVKKVLSGEPIILNDEKTSSALAQAITKSKKISRKKCRNSFEEFFTASHMCEGYAKIYKSIATKSPKKP